MPIFVTITQVESDERSLAVTNATFIYLLGVVVELVPVPKGGGDPVSLRGKHGEPQQTYRCSALE